MGNVFDKMQNVLHDTINKVFGYSVLWTPSVGGTTQTAQCLFNNPTKTYKMGGAEYHPNLYSIDWKKNDLPGLYEAVRKGGYESIFIYEIGSDPSTAIEYNCMAMGATWDGKTYHLIIEPAN